MVRIELSLNLISAVKGRQFCMINRKMKKETLGENFTPEVFI